ncbi:MAG: hypothetical protein M3680_34725 [Myxococcota bacterium]|nr:hypothetical protein [Myxococcota bacterium]
MRHVRGLLFVDYVRMLRAQKSVDWSTHLTAEDIWFLSTKIDPDAWYPMTTFERLGNEILRTVAHGEMFAVRLWGRYSAGKLHAKHPNLLAPGDPIETLNRFRVMRQTFFDFSALEVPMLLDDAAHVVVRYHMGTPAEEAACYQTMGFFEGLLELAGAQDIDAAFREKSWANALRTLLVIRWRMPGA